MISSNDLVVNEDRQFLPGQRNAQRRPRRFFGNLEVAVNGRLGDIVRQILFYVSSEDVVYQVGEWAKAEKIRTKNDISELCKKMRLLDTTVAPMTVKSTGLRE
jgi:hypothetical protein